MAAVDFPAAAFQDGQHGRVITGVTHDHGQITSLSYGWSGEAGTAYETSTATATLDTAGAQVQALAAQGYIVTAFGGEETDGLILVGTRVAGDTLARAAIVSSDVNDLIKGGYAALAMLQKRSGSSVT